MIDIFTAVGSDRYITVGEVRRFAGDHEQLTSLWDMYQQHFDGFCESRLDPMHHRLAHPAASIGALALDPSESILVVGTAPSALLAMHALRHLRHRVRIITSPRGAELLADHDVTADLLLIEHRTALDAHHSARHFRDGRVDVVSTAPLVATDWRTPASLVASVPRDRLFVPDPLPTWGLWPATAVALAIAGGARRIGLLGIDLGSAAQIKPEFVPLIHLLRLLSQLAPGATFDCGNGVLKDGWPRCSLEDLAGAPIVDRLNVNKKRAPSLLQRHMTASEAMVRLMPVISRARRILAASLAARAGHPDRATLRDCAREMLAWGDDQQLRADIQETLGISFLPRFWRSGINTDLGDALWRPLALSTHEIVEQAASLTESLDRLAA